MKIYTRTGDEGETGLYAGPRVPKSHPRIAAYGDVDELNAVIGLLRAEPPPASMHAVLEQIQHDLFVVGAELATPDPAKRGSQVIAAAHVTALEEAIDGFEADLAPLTQFILPGGTRCACLLHLARTVCRRAERQVVHLASLPNEQVSERVIHYLNRLSDLLFVLARAANASAGLPDVPWKQ